MVGTIEYFVPLEGMINMDEEIAKIESEIKRYEGFIKGVNANWVMRHLWQMLPKRS